MRRLMFLVLVAIASPAAAERMTIAVSMPDIMINSNFTGTPVTIFGVMENDSAEPAPTDQKYGVAILVLGPNESVVARRKDRVVGIWLNHSARTIGAAPNFYALSTSGALSTLSSPPVLKRLQLGFENIGFVYNGSSGRGDPEAIEFRDAFLRLKQQAGLYSDIENVTFIGNSIFRSTAFIPANIPVGHYTVLAYLFSDGGLIAHAQDRINVTKSGLEGTTAAFARGQSLIYGLLCAGLALFIGWAGGVIFRRD